MKRIIIAVEPRGELWRVRAAYDGWAATFVTQAESISQGRAYGRSKQAPGLLAELRIRKRNGQWSSNGSTYGKDPRRTRG